jgi:hypothetical protein
MKIYKLKADPNLPHHYIIAVAVKPIQSKTPGNLFLKYRPFYIHHSQIEKLRDAAILTQDKLFSTTSAQALKIFGVYELAKTFSMFKVSCQVNMCSLFHFYSKFKIDEEWFKTFVKNTNSSESERKKLFDAKVY